MNKNIIIFTTIEQTEIGLVYGISMGAKIKILTLGSFILVILLIIIYFGWNYPNKWKYHPDCSSYKNEISRHYGYSYNLTTSPEAYRDDCETEYKKNISFPIDYPDYALLHYNKLFKKNKKLSQKQLDTLLTIINDSSKYVWGELGTPYADRYVTFHLNSGRCIGLFKIDYEGNTWATPNLARMKWGLIGDIWEIISILEQE